jgi:hypothetical protein
MDQVPITIFIAVGTIIAALISALVALFSAVMAKEMKVSELRQEWIIELRKDLAKLTPLVDRVFFTYFLAEDKDDEYTFNFIAEHASELQNIDELICRLIMMLNPDEHSILIQRIEKIEGRFSRSSFGGEYRDIQDIHRDYTNESIKVLKEEWLKVKGGEPAYRKMIGGAKISVAVSLITLAAFGVVSLIIP